MDLGLRSMVFYDPGAIMSVEDALFLSDHGKSLLVLRAQNNNPDLTFLLVVALRDVLALAFRYMEKTGI